MSTKRADNDEERFARIDALVEEYRIKHDDLEAYVREIRDRMIADKERSRLAVTVLRDAFHRSKRDA